MDTNIFPSFVSEMLKNSSYSFLPYPLNLSLLSFDNNNDEYTFISSCTTGLSLFSLKTTAESALFERSLNVSTQNDEDFVNCSKVISVGEKKYIALLTLTGLFQVFDEQGMIRYHFESLSVQAGDQIVGQSIAYKQQPLETLVFIATNSGHILVYKCRIFGRRLNVEYVSRVSASFKGICDLTSIFCTSYYIISLHAFGTIRVWNLVGDTLEKIGQIETGNQPDACGISFSLQESELVAIGSSLGCITLYNMHKEGKLDLVSKIYAHGGWITAIDALPMDSRTFIATISEDHSLQVFRLDHKTKVEITQVHTEYFENTKPFGVKLIKTSLEALYTVVTGYGENNIRLIEINIRP